MKTSSVALLIFLASSSAEAATIRGHIHNLTTGGDGRAESVRLLDMAAELDQIGTLLDVEGEFAFENIESRDGAPYLLQTQSGGVLYSQPVRLASDELEVEVNVYDSAPSVDQISYSMHHLIFERHEDALNAMEFLEVENASDPPVAIWVDNGPLTVQLPPEAMEPFEVSVSTASGTPLHQELLETDVDHVYTIPYAIKPGTTRVVIRYQVPYEDEHYSFQTVVHHPVQRRSILTSPDDMELSGEGLERSEEEAPIAGYAVYLGTPMEAGATLALSLSGGSSHAADPHAGLQSGGEDPHAGLNAIQEVVRRPHRFSASRARFLLMGGLGAILLFGLFSASRPSERQAASSRVDELSDRFAGGNIDRSEFERQLRKLRGEHA